MSARPPHARAGAPSRVPARELTAETATVFHRAHAWVAVEDAQRTLNAAMRRLGSPDVARLDAARLAYETSPSYSNRSFDSALRAELWREVARLQQIVNQRAEGQEAVAGAAAVLDAALAEYVDLGGSSKRQPGDGGLA
jgi:hypothetical protein